MTRYRFYQLDVFTDRALAGNPLAVFPDATGLPDATMQALAREMNLSETTFVLPSRVATKRLRIFTPTDELPLAGHPVIGTWWLLAELGAVPNLDSSGITTVTQETGHGVLPVDITCRGGRPTTVTMTQTVPEYLALVEDRARLGEMLGGSRDVVAPTPTPQVVSTALPQLMVPIVSHEALSALPVGGAGMALVTFLKDFGTDCAMCYVATRTDTGAEVHARLFALGLGVPEDPATGSASGALGAYLAHHRLVGETRGVSQITVRQGVEIGRPSRIEVEVAAVAGEVGRVRVGGQAVRVIEGEVVV